MGGCAIAEASSLASKWKMPANLHPVLTVLQIFIGLETIALFSSQD